MSNVQNMLTSVIGGGLVGGVSTLLVSGNKGKESFDNNKKTLSSTTIIIICVIVIILMLLIAIATYNLTGSGWQTFFSLLFGVFYMIIATLYYGFSGYKYQKKI